MSITPSVAVDSVNIEHINGKSSSDDIDWWPMFRHDLHHSGYSTSNAPDTNNVLWSYTSGYMGDSSPTVADGKVYIGSFDFKVYCLNANTGAYVWSYPTGDNVGSSPAVADGKLYIGSHDGKVYCLNANNGAYVWSYPTGGDVFSSPAVGDSKVNFGSEDYNVYCLNANTGGFIWSYTTGENVYSSPAVADGKVYFGSDDYNVYCLKADTGAYVWSYTTGHWVSSSPAVADGKVYIVSNDFNVYAFWSNNPPDKSTITGQTSGKVGVEYEYTFHASDPDGDDVKYYIDWGDGNSNETDFNSPCSPVEVCHIYEEKGEYNITAYAEDEKGLISNTSKLKVNIPRVRVVYHPLLLQLFDRFPLLERLLSLIRVI